MTRVTAAGWIGTFVVLAALGSGPASAQENPPAAGTTEGAQATEKAEAGLSVWRRARQAAWEGRREEAVEAYRRLTEIDSENPDAWGELGNVLLQLGEREPAADAFAEAAVRLHRGGDPMMAWRLQRIIVGMNPERAESLRRELGQR